MREKFDSNVLPFLLITPAYSSWKHVNKTISQAIAIITMTIAGKLYIVTGNDPMRKPFGPSGVKTTWKLSFSWQDCQQSVWKSLLKDWWDASNPTCWHLSSAAHCEQTGRFNASVSRMFQCTFAHLYSALFNCNSILFIWGIANGAFAHWRA